MRKQHTPERQNASMKGNLEREWSRLADVHSPVSSRVTATEQFQKKKIRQTDDSPSVAEADDVQSSEYAADTDQPVLVAQLSDEALSVTGEGQASGADITMLALAAGRQTGSDVGQASAANTADSGNGWWWLGGGLAAIAVGGGIAASGGSGGGSSPAATSVNGTVTDGPVQGAQIYYDVNGNRIYDAGTDTAVLDAEGNPVVTDASGNFSFSTTTNPATIRLVAHGGIDTVTGEAVTVDFAAPAGYTQINPITSAIAAYMEAHPGATAAQAEAAVETALGLPNLNYAEANLFDPPAEVPAETALAAQQAAAILATTAIVVQSSGSDGDPFAFVAANLGSGGDTSALVAAVIADPSIAGTDTATRLNDTVTAINEAVNLDAIGDAVNNTLYPDPPALGDYSATLNENSANGTAVVTVDASDPDGDAVSYAITAGNASGAFAIDSATGAITVADSSKLDFETVTSYSLTVQASDGTLTDTGTVTITLTGVNDNTPVVTSGSTGSVAENAALSTVIYDAAATDADAGSTIAYSLKTGTGDASLLNIDSTTGQVTLKNPADFETKASYIFTVIASDGTYSSERAVTVNVTNVNEAPVIVSNGGGSTAAVSILENRTAVTTVAATDVDAGDGKTFSITGGADAALFTIDPSTGVLAFLGAPDYESPADSGGNNVYDVQVTVTDTAGLADLQNLAVTVTNVHENLVIEASGAWIDINGNGVKDGDDSTLADFTPGTGNFDLAANPVIVHYNDLPDTPVNLAGFGSDDRIEIDISSFINRGYLAAGMFSDPDLKTIDQFAPTTSGTTSNFLTLNSFGAYQPRFVVSEFGSGLWSSAHLGLFRSGGSLQFSSYSRSTSTFQTMAVSLPSDLDLTGMIDFVNVPVQPETVHVIVERAGASIDFDGDGIWDRGENWKADFSSGGNADLADRSVVIHFNDVPYRGLDLTGFGTDDKIEFDVRALRDNHILNYTAANDGLASFAFAGLGLVGYYFSWTSNALGTTTTNFTWFRVNHSSALRPDFNGIEQGPYGITLNYINTSVNGRTQGLIAYWNDPSNALNSIPELLPDYVSTPTSNYAQVLDRLSANHYDGLIEFVWPVNVVVDSIGAWIDTNADGYHDADETTPADLAADLKSSPVEIHFNGIPTTPLDFSGFGSDDLVVIDLDALRYGSPSNALFSQSWSTASKWTDNGGFTGGYVSTTGGYASVFLHGSVLKFGHSTPRTFSTLSGSIYTQYFYTATRSLEGTIAINAGALTDNFDQVMFVTSNPVVT